MGKSRTLYLFRPPQTDRNPSSRWAGRVAVLATLGLLALQAASGQGLPAEVAKIIKANGIPAARVGLYVAPVEGEPVVEHNMDKPFNPASAIKLLIAQAALELLGPEFTWKTELRAAAPVAGGVLRGDLYFVGSGDPSITHERLLGLVAGLRARGVERIDGSVIVDDTLFSLPQHDPGAFDSAGAKPYNGGAGAAMVGFGASRIVIRNGTDGITAFAEPPSRTLTLVNQLRSQRSRCRGNWRGRISELLRRNGDGTAKLTLRGNYPTGCGELSFYMLAQDDPAAHLAGAIQANFAMLGGSGGEAWRRGKVPPGAKPLAVSESPPLVEVLIGMNKHSNNIMARNLFLSLAGTTGIEPYTTSASRAAVAQWLADKGISSEGMHIENGSGLARETRITPRQFAGALHASSRESLYAELIATLSILGVDGTTRRWLRKTAATGNAHLKTGTLRGVRAAVGFVHASGGQNLLFVAMIDWKNTASGRKLLQDLLAWAHAKGGSSAAAAALAQ